MAKRPTLLQHFRSFAHQNHIDDADIALQYFAVFGGTGWDIDITQNIDELIESKILRNYESLHNSMSRYTHSNPVYHKLLSIVASGTEHEHDAFSKARIGKDRGEEAVDYLEHKRLIKFDLSVEAPSKDSSEKSDRLVFELPFMRFWFALVSPYYKGIAAEDYEEFREAWSSVKDNFYILICNLLIRDLTVERLKKKYPDDKVVVTGSYYDKNVQIDILTKLKSGKIIAGACKYSKQPAKKNMIDTLKDKCKRAELDINEFMLFSRNGFADEWEQKSNEDIMLVDDTGLASLLDSLSNDDLLVYKNRKY